MGFLRALAGAVLTGLRIVNGFVPAASQYVQNSPVGMRALDTLTKLFGIAQATEVQIETLKKDPKWTTMSGADKFAAALPLSTQVILVSEAVAGKEIADEEMFMEGVRLMQEGAFKVQSSLKSKIEIIKTEDVKL